MEVRIKVEAIQPQVVDGVTRRKTVNMLHSEMELDIAKLGDLMKGIQHLVNKILHK